MLFVCAGRKDAKEVHGDARCRAWGFLNVSGSAGLGHFAVASFAALVRRDLGHVVFGVAWYTWG